MEIQDNGYISATHYQARELRASCTESLEFRGHDTEANWSELVKPTKSNSWRAVWDYTCPDCGLDASIDTRPAPNGIDIGGPAVALSCQPSS